MSTEEVKPKTFPFATPRAWRNKLKPEKVLKALPFFQPIGEESRFDFKGLLKEVMPEFAGDLSEDLEVYSGLVLQLGWIFENENRVWIGVMDTDIKNQFEDLGPWNEEVHRPLCPEPLIKSEEP